MMDVVAAPIWNNNKFIICQLRVHKARALLQEFVGGKVESSENKEQALIRECREEIPQYTFSPTDEDILKKIIEVYNG